jgi:hypothetical protein
MRNFIKSFESRYTLASRFCAALLGGAFLFAVIYILPLVALLAACKYIWRALP